MPASTSDKITDTRNAARPNSARVTSPRNAGGTSLVCDDLSGWSTASKVHFVTYRLDSSSNIVAGSQLDCSGIVSGNTINSLTVIDGTDNGSSVNDVVEMLPTAAWGQDLADALTSQHTRTGAHSGVTNTGGMTTDTLTVSGAASVGGNLSVTGYAQDKGKNLYEIRDEQLGDYVVSGGVWSGDAYASTLNASMTALVCYINGQRGTISAVTARAFTASKDTYIDVLNSSGTFSLVYTEVANNAASPSLAASSIRLGVVVSGATNIAAATSINQGQPERTVPTTCNPGKSGTDSLGNVIRNTNPLGILAPINYIATYHLGGNSTSYTDHATVTFTLLNECRVLIDANVFGQWSGTPAVQADFRVVVDGSESLYARNDIYATNDAWSAATKGRITLAAGTHTIKTQSKHTQGVSSFVGSYLSLEAKPVPA